MKKLIRYSFTASFLFLPLSTYANDGRDRTQTSSPNRFELFPLPLGEQSGYRILDKDGTGGADGTERFRFARPQAVSLVKIAAFETYKQLGAVAAPMAIFDLSAENGDTPVDFTNKVPRGRHPGGSHDGGINLDLGYYLKSTRGKVFQPDLAACTEHFSAAGEDLSQCQGAPDRLAVSHQAYFLLTLARLNRDLFHRDLIEEIGIDLKVRQAVVQELENWRRQKKFDVTADLIRDLTQSFTSDEWDGWASSHHHHIHLRLRDISMYGLHRNAYENLRTRETLNDEVILRKLKKPLINVRLYSQGLNRSLEAEILGGESGEGRFHVSSEPWVNADPSRLPRISASWDIDLKTDHAASIEANLSGSLYKTEISLPEQPPYLFVSVDPRSISGHIKQVGGKYEADLTMPDAYRLYVTAIKTTPADLTADTEFAIAEVTLASRMKIKIPLVKPR
ncbi:MAG: hypothetical protein EOP04_09165 [Proteobacteria bacterium]|nr:MAG: hypothetical protein EOP04_09165 [Pseudomonadota bacterium]